MLRQQHGFTCVCRRCAEEALQEAGPASHPIGEFAIDLPRPRDVAEVRVTPRFIELHQAIWDVLREEVLKGYAQQKKAA